MTIYSFEIELMTLILKLDQDIVQIHLHAKNEVPGCSGSKVTAWTDRQTSRLTDPTEIILQQPAYADGNQKLAYNNRTKFNSAHM